MDRLPQEIIDRIAALLPGGRIEIEEPPAPSQDIPQKRSSIFKKLVSKILPDDDKEIHQKGNKPNKYWTRASAAAISYQWQRAVEPAVYSNLVVTYLGLEKLKTALERRPERRAYLRSLTVVLALTHEHWTGVAIKDSLQPLYQALKYGRDEAAVDLTLRFVSGHPYLRHHTRQGIVFDRIHSEPLGAMPCVRTLDFTPPAPATEKERRNVLHLHLMEQATLVMYFPNLQSVVYYYVESESQDIREQSRDMFAYYIAKDLPERRHITKFSLSLSIGILGLRIASPMGVGADSYENLYGKMHAATQHATDVSYSGVVGSSLFQPAPDAADEYIWLSLRNLTVCMTPLSPTGQWYFDGDNCSPITLDTSLAWQPDYAKLQQGQQQQHSSTFDDVPGWFQELPEEDNMLPLLSALAGLLERLPVLETARLVARRGMGEKAAPWAVCYLAPGKTSRWVNGSDMDIDRPRVWFVTGRWRPGDTLVQRFRRAGQGAGHGEDASVIYWSILEPPVLI